MCKMRIPRLLRTISLLLCLASVTGLSACSTSIEKSTIEDYSKTETTAVQNTVTEPLSLSDNISYPASTLPIENARSASAEEFRAIWLSFYEISKIFDNISSPDAFYAKADEVFAHIAARGFNNIFVHIRPFADSIYPSNFFPWSKYISGQQGKALSFDPLYLMLEAAHAHGLLFHAWINPYRILLSDDFSQLCEGHPALLWHREGSQDERLIVCKEGIFFNPASQEALTLILNGVREIAENYPVDGIHIDDYFYPTTSKDIDDDFYRAYISHGGQMSLAEWRRANINAMVSSMYSASKAKNPSILFSISPSGNIDYNLNSMYADIYLWMAQSGYCDLIIPQIYFGFENPKQPFVPCLNSWLSIPRCDSVSLAVGLALYKSGKKDIASPTNPLAETEWIDKSDIIARQILTIRSSELLCGFALFSYDSFFGGNLSAQAIYEVNAIITLLQ